MGSIKGIRRGNYKTLKPVGKVFCSYCNKSYTRRQSVLQHLRSVHLNIRKTCSICAKKYTSTSTYNRHLKIVHGVADVLTNFDVPFDTVPSNSSNLTQLSFESDDKFPSMAKILVLKENNKFGKYISTVKDIDVGQVVLAAPAFASIEYLVCTDSGCFACGKVSKCKITCSTCIDVWFCSNQCKGNRKHREKCDSSFDRLDCRAVRLVTQMIVNAVKSVSDITALLQFCRGLLFMKKRSKNCKPPYSQYGQILSLKEHPEPENPAIARRVVKNVIQRVELEELNSKEAKRILFYLANQHTNVLALNAFSEEWTISKGGKCIRFFIFNILSRINHSCQPNISHYIDDDDVTYCIATQPIKAGEQLFINYLQHMQLETEERKKYIKESWNFDCSCQKCSRN